MQSVFAYTILQSNVQIQFKNLIHKIHEFYTKPKYPSGSYSSQPSINV